MVQEVTRASKELSVDDYLTPLTTIRDSLLNPPSLIPLKKLLILLPWHLPRLTSPWKPFKPPESSSVSKLDSQTIPIPSTSLTINLDPDIKKWAIKLSDHAKMDETDALLMYKSYKRYALEGGEELKEGEMLERLLSWYSEEVIAAGQIVMTCMTLARTENDLTVLAFGVKEEVVGEVASLIENVFRAFGGLAQHQLEGVQRTDYPLFWATHQLRLQDNLLQLLFTALWQTPDREPSVSEALIKGTVMSDFGAMQANREFWEADQECQRLASRIRDGLVLISLESMCLGIVISGDEIEGTLLENTSRILSIHDFLMKQSEELEMTDKTEGEYPTWPMPIVCLAWAVILRYLPDERDPASNSGIEAFQVMATRALKPTSGLFWWLGRLLKGPLLEPSRETGTTQADLIIRRKVIKDLLIGLTGLIQINFIPDRIGLYSVWEMLLRGNDREVSQALCDDYWTYDYAYDTRRSILDESRFPLLPSQLLQVLGALAGSSSLGFDQDTCVRVCQYFTHLPRITFVTRSDAYRVTGRNTSNQREVQVSRPIVLPGGAIVAIGTPGVIISNEESPQDVITWDTSNSRLSGWALLSELLREAARVPRAQYTAIPSLSASRNPVHMTVADLGVLAETDEILATGLSFLQSTLKPTSPLTPEIIAALSPDRSRPPMQSIIEILVHILSTSTSPDLSSRQIDITSSTLELLSTTLQLASGEAWSIVRSSGLFISSTTTSKKSLSSRLIASDSSRADYRITLSLLRLVQGLVKRPANLPVPDDVLLRAALHTIHADVWSQYQGWRYRDVTQKWTIAAILADTFDTVLRHPFGEDGKLTSAASILVDSFIVSASPITYRPIIDVVSQYDQLIRRLVGLRRSNDAQQVVSAFEAALSLMSTLFRLSVALQIPSNALPTAMMSLNITSLHGQKVQLVDLLLDLTCQPSSPEPTKLVILKTLRTYLHSSPDGVPLSGLLRNAERTFYDVSQLTNEEASVDQRSAAWKLLASAASTPGCAVFCIGSPAVKPLGEILGSAVEQITNWEDTFQSSPLLLSAQLAYVGAIIQSSPSSKTISELRKNPGFWQNIIDITSKHVPPPPTFTLSMHSEDFAIRIRTYAHSIRSKAEATSLLSTELKAILESDDDPREAKAQPLILSLFRNTSQLQEASLTAVHSSCNPELHTAEQSKLSSAGVKLSNIRHITLTGEREYGLGYLYDDTSIHGDNSVQASVNFAIDMLNLSWSMLDADISLTRAFLSLCEQVSSWVEGDALASEATLRAGVAVAERLAEEDRGGDVMFSIQHDRLCILSILLDFALGDSSPDGKLISRLCSSIRSMLESQVFPPILSMRQTGLPAIHRPILEIVYAAAQHLSTVDKLTAEGFFEPALSFVVEAADVVLDAVTRNQPSPLVSELGVIVGNICELSKGALNDIQWLDKLGEYDLIGRSLEVLTRARITPLPNSSLSTSSKSNPNLNVNSSLSQSQKLSFLKPSPTSLSSSSTQPITSTSSGHVSPAVSAILLFHLALSHIPSSAEKLAVSGLLPAYSDNVISSLAETASLLPDTSPHAAWCSMLSIIKTLLTTLPDTLSYIRSDVIPFIRVCTPQLTHAMSWDGQSSMSTSATEEMELVVEVFYTISTAVGGSTGITSEYGPLGVGLLRGLLYALSHPRLLSASIIPTDEEEQEMLMKELETGETNEPELLDWEKTPLLASRTAGLLRVGRTVVMTLVNLTDAWESLKMEGVMSELILRPSEEDGISASTDPIGIINDLHSIYLPLSITPSPANGEQRSVAAVAKQFTEAAALLSTAQLVGRHSLLPRNTSEDDDMELEIEDRKSGGDKEGHVLRELEGDLLGLLDGGKGLMGWLRVVAERSFSGGE
ncbi:hypothetical protein M231_03703 [Tremella mesenterica]|uniref:Nucleoporin Nup188 N-terminal subdomain III domain-containing protein n=1 Tax=Tremella mesenterica TaxID=5217 RepID=A0A4Q1BMC0_TREME|nr:hypothetical protein M231_03703 [Tremella mesenterica]